jgi:hypothetical protein
MREEKDGWRFLYWDEPIFDEDSTTEESKVVDSVEVKINEKNKKGDH